jgi:glycosyltransferase involved in cell wall biosynthesis
VQSTVDLEQPVSAGQADGSNCLLIETILVEAGSLRVERPSMKILLIGNYPADAQESMQRYSDMLRTGLSAAGHSVTVVLPRPVLNRRGRAGGAWKWIGYLDKFVLSPSSLRRAAREADIVHICDHGNSMYVPQRSDVPYVVTCHDLLAVRGALGEDTDCPAGFAGRRLQRQILRGLRRASAVVCVSSATLRDVQRLLADYSGKLVVVPNALSHPYRRLDPQTNQRRLSSLIQPASKSGYVLHVGSNLRRKNREGVLRALAASASSWNGTLVVAGQPLTGELRQLARELSVLDRIVEVVKPSNDVLEILYNGALALLFPSRFEGFGWPLIEAQACGCPVICGNREPLPEVTGGAAIICDPDDHHALADAIVRLSRQGEMREDLRRRGLENAASYGNQRTISGCVTLYEQLAAAA